MTLAIYMRWTGLFLCLLAINGCKDSSVLPEPKEDVKPLSVLQNPSSKLNDTGITWRGIIPKGVDDNCADDVVTEDTSSQQDCNTGRDVILRDNSNGMAGFSYVKIDANGKTLPNDAHEWRCVADEVSGFMWEVKSTTVDLHNSSDKFTWYNANKKTNGGDIGDWNNRGNHCYGYEEGKPKTYCHTEQFVSRVNKQGLCGFYDWRLPTRQELTSLIHFGRTEPAIDTQFFPHTQHDFYWTNSPTATRTLEAWTVSFEYGFTTPMRRTDTRYARLVRTVHTAKNTNEVNNSKVNNTKNNAL